MNFAKKMILISPEVLERMKSSNIETPGKETLESQMNKVLSEKNVDDNDKWRHFEQMLQSFVRSASKAREPIQIPIVENDDVGLSNESLPLEKEIISSMGGSKGLSRKASLLLDFLRKSPHISWNDRGIVRIRNHSLVNSNILDLVNDVLKTRKSATSEGWYEFAHLLADLNVPRELIPNNYRWQYIQRIKNGSTRTGSSVKRRNVDDEIASGKIKRNNFNDYSDMRRQNPYHEEVNQEYQEEVSDIEQEEPEVEPEDIDYETSNNHRRRQIPVQLWNHENFQTRFSKRRKVRTEPPPSRLARTREPKKRKVHNGLDLNLPIKVKKKSDRTLNNLNRQDMRKRSLVDSRWYSNYHQTVPRKIIRSQSDQVSSRWRRFDF